MAKRANYTARVRRQGPIGRVKRPSRRKWAAWRAASAENTRPLWLAATTQWSASPGSRVSSSDDRAVGFAVEAGEVAGPGHAARCPATTPTWRLPSQRSNPRCSSACAAAQRRRHPAACRPGRVPRRCRAAANPGRPLRVTGKPGSRRSASSAIRPPRLWPTRVTRSLSRKRAISSGNRDFRAAQHAGVAEHLRVEALGTQARAPAAPARPWHSRCRAGAGRVRSSEAATVRRRACDAG